MVFSRRKALRRIAFTSPLRRTDARFTVSYTAAWSAMPSRKSWLNPSWRIRRASTSSLPFRRVPMTWSSQVWLRNTLKTKACTRCLSAGGSAVREHSRSTRVSAKERPACQLLRQFSAVWRGEGGLFFTGELYMRNVQVSTCKTPGGKRGMPGQLRISPVFSGAAHFLPVNGPEFSSWSFLVSARLCLSSGSLPI